MRELPPLYHSFFRSCDLKLFSSHKSQIEEGRSSGKQMANVWRTSLCNSSDTLMPAVLIIQVIGVRQARPMGSESPFKSLLVMKPHNSSGLEFVTCKAGLLVPF